MAKRNLPIELVRKATRKSARDFVDYDYLDQLSPDELAWLAKFTGEYYQNKFNDKPLHATKAQRKKCYDADNARRRDLWIRRNKAAVNPDTLETERTDDEDL